MGEINQIIGQEFVMELKDFLEGTENFGSIYTSYNPYQITVRPKYDGSTKGFDIIAGYKKDKAEIEVFIEAKDYSSQSDLNNQYKKFLIDCFSVWVFQKHISTHWNAKFLFISTYPFSCSKYSRLKDLNFLKEILHDDLVLFAYCSENEQIVVSEFLNSIDILIFSKSINMFSVDLKRLLKKYKLFS